MSVGTLPIPADIGYVTFEILPPGNWLNEVNVNREGASTPLSTVLKDQ